MIGRTNGYATGTRLGLSHRVLYTNPCTNQPPDLLKDGEAASNSMAS